MSDDKKEVIPEEKHDDVEQWYDTWTTDMKADMEDYIEEQGIYIRQ